MFVDLQKEVAIMKKLMHPNSTCIKANNNTKSLFFINVKFIFMHLSQPSFKVLHLYEVLDDTNGTCASTEYALSVLCNANTHNHQRYPKFS